MTNRVSPHPGIGLFPSKNAIEGARKAGEAIEELSSKPVDEHVQQQLLVIARHYDADKKYDAALTLANVRKECRQLAKHIGGVEKAIAGLSPESLMFVTGGHKFTRLNRSELDEITSRLVRLRQAAERPICKQNKAPRTCLPNAIERLVALREEMEARPFASNWNEDPVVVGAASAFIGTDATFVLKVLQAIDRKVTFSQVRSIGKNRHGDCARKK